MTVHGRLFVWIAQLLLLPAMLTAAPLGPSFTYQGP